MALAHPHLVYLLLEMYDVSFLVLSLLPLFFSPLPSPCLPFPPLPEQFNLEPSAMWEEVGNFRGWVWVSDPELGEDRVGRECVLMWVGEPRQVKEDTPREVGLE